MLGGCCSAWLEALGAGYIGDLTGNVFARIIRTCFAFIVLIACWCCGPRGCSAERVGSGRDRIDRTLEKHRAAPWAARPSWRSRCSRCPFALRGVAPPGCGFTNLAILFVFLSLGLNIVVGFAGLLDLGYVASTRWAPTSTPCSLAALRHPLAVPGRSCRSGPRWRRSSEC